MSFFLIQFCLKVYDEILFDLNFDEKYDFLPYFSLIEIEIEREKQNVNFFCGFA